MKDDTKKNGGKEEEDEDEEKYEWLHGGCASFNEMINNQSARCFRHHLNPSTFVNVTHDDDDDDEKKRKTKTSKTNNSRHDKRETRQGFDCNQRGDCYVLDKHSIDNDIFDNE
jgi:hypothetical protein